jgi:calcineurin-like phosphoesterase family protein
MNSCLVEKHNSVVKDGDTVYHIGDFSLYTDNLPLMKHCLKYLNGKHHLILGNHDTLKPWEYIDIGFLTVHTALELHTEYGNFVLGHDPAISVINKDWKFLCGHIHDLFCKIKNVVNVGVDVWDFKPVSAEEIIKLYKEK